MSDSDPFAPLANGLYNQRLKELLSESKWNMTALWQLPEKEFVGYGVARDGRDRNFVSSLVYICPICGRDWLRICLVGKHWQPVKRKCREHGAGFLIPWRKAYSVRVPSWVLREEVLRINRAKPKNYEIALMLGE
jgi:hypothetical protein